MVALWLEGAWRGGLLLRTAVISEVVFMGGHATGLLLSLILDSRPSTIFLICTGAEPLLGILLKTQVGLHSANGCSRCSD